MASHDSARVRALLRTLYGRDEFEDEAGVVHVLSAFAQGDEHRVIRIGPRAPRSETDRFVLGFSRARADAILTTGKILRDEPDLHYDLPEPHRAGLLAWRSEVHRRVEPPRVVVLTRGLDVEPDHPIFRSWARPILFTTPAGAETWRRHTTFPVVVDPECSARAAISWAQRTGLRVVSIEAGPSTALDLYRDPCVIDEVLLSTTDIVPAAGAAGGAFLSRTALRHVATLCSSHERDEASGRWTFERWRCPAGVPRGC